MKFHPQLTSPRALILGVISLLLCPVAQATEFSIEKTERLGDRLNEIASVPPTDSGAQATLPTQNIYFPGTYWLVPSEIPAQQEQKEALIRALAELRNTGLDSYQRQGLSDLIQKLPVTGRVLLNQQDPRLLQANPKQNPILEPGQTLGVVTDIHTVSVIREDGTICTLQHRPGVYAQHYVSICHPDDKVSDVAWVIQPDGQIQKVGLSIWNQTSQNQPAPGSWIWSPSRLKLSQELVNKLPYLNKIGLSEEFSQQFASFIATQGPSGRPEFEQIIPSDRSYVDGPVTIAQSQLNTPIEYATLANDAGEIGLLQTPTARMMPAGSALFNYSNTSPYSNFNFMFQPFDRLEAGFRYTKISNVLYGPQSLSGNQSYTDKSIDAKFKLNYESAYLPEIALGMRDLVGTGLFSSEYLVANKRTGNFDWSLGIGWGYLGSRGDIKNPFSLLGSQWNSRAAFSGEGGNFSFGNYFHGTSAIFGGVQYQTPIHQLVLKAELDGNNYQSEPFSDNQVQRLPLNFAAVYQWQDAYLSVGLERGNTAMISLTFHGRLDQLSTPKVSEIPAIKVQVKSIGEMTMPPASLTGTMTDNSPSIDAAVKTQSLDLNSTINDLEMQTGWHVKEIRQQKETWIVSFHNTTGIYLNDRIDRGIAVLHRDAPLSIQRFVLRHQNAGLKTVQQVVNRKRWMQAQTQALPPSLKKEAEIKVGNFDAIDEKIDSSDNTQSEVLVTQGEKRLETNYGLGIQQSVGGPDAFVLFALMANASATYHLWDGAWISGTTSLRLVDNYGKFTYDAPSNLPRVRTYVREYLTSSAITIPNLQATQVAQVGNSNFFSAYGGILEFMYGGVGGEWLYRPVGSRLAVGVDINEVKQRDFEQNFNFRDYSVMTGHLTTYWDTGVENILVKASVGQYLAGDQGGTLDVSRIFDNGVKIGAYATRTNVSAAQFGEGSFDKGIYVSIPFDAFFTKNSSSRADFIWQPLYRDGGAKLNRQVELYNQTSLRDYRAFQFGPPNPY